jgi:hypothetical protein
MMVGHCLTLRLLLVGWGLGVLMAFTWPAVSMEYVSVVVNTVPSYELTFLTERRWVVTRTDTVGLMPTFQSVVTLERPRYWALKDQRDLWLADQPDGWWILQAWDAIAGIMLILACLSFLVAYQVKQ